MDFTLSLFRTLLTALMESGYCFKTVREYSGSEHTDHSPLIVLRHDVDKRPVNSLETARIEKKLGIIGTYYFRIHSDSYNEDIIKAISSMGHEIGYHYEDCEIARKKIKVQSRKLKGVWEEQLTGNAIKSFGDNLAKLREIAPIDTICMHGSPLSPVDSRILWKYYDYGNFGITAEPYFDFSLEKVLYLTDTGRRWDGTTVSIRDKVYIRDAGYYSGWERNPVPGSAMLMTERSAALQRQYNFRGTESIINAVRSQKMHERMIITFHPQRWSDNFSAWLTEIAAQNLKNPIKYLMNNNKKH